MGNKAIDKNYLLRQLKNFEDDILSQKSIASEDGYHYFRYYNGKFAYKDGNTWIDIAVGDGQDIGLFVENGQLHCRYKGSSSV